MNRWTRTAYFGLCVTVFVLALSGVSFADALDDAGAKVGTFLTRAGTIMAGLIPTAAALAIGALAAKRSAAKAMGEEEGMSRSGNQIVEVLKLTAIGTGASLIVAVAGLVLK